MTPPSSFLCRWGFHDWKIISARTSIFEHALKECSRCHRRRGFLGKNSLLNKPAPSKFCYARETEHSTMTANQLIEDMAQLGPQELHVLFHYLADHLYEARLSRDQKLCDATDFKEFLRECGDVSLGRSRKRMPAVIPQQRRY